MSHTSESSLYKYRHSVLLKDGYFGLSHCPASSEKVTIILWSLGTGNLNPQNYK